MEQKTEPIDLNEVTDADFDKINSHIGEVDLKEIDLTEPTAEKEPEEKEEPKQTDPKKTSLGDIVKAPFALKLVNIIVPPLAVKGYKSAGYRISKQDMELNRSEMGVLAEPLQNYLNFIKVDLKHPAYMFAFAITSVYGAKMVDISETATKINKKQKRDDVFQVEPVNTEEILDDLTKTWDESLYTPEQVTLIKATAKRRNKGVKEAIEWLNKKNAL